MKIIIAGLTFALITVAACAHSKQDPNAKFCYLPTKSNVSYSDVLALDTASPVEVIKYGDGSNQFAELWLPDNLDPLYKPPLVVFIHGGCWSNSYDIKHSHGLSTAFAKMGYATWSIEYNRTGDSTGGWPGSLNDISMALDYLPNLKRFPVDLRKVALVGHSAGGHLALLAGAERKASLKGVIGLAAIVDLEKYAEGDNSCQSAVTPFMGGSLSEIPLLYRVANPARAPLHSNSILIHGDKDSIVPLTQSQSSNLKQITVSGAGHFDMIHPETETFQVLLKELATILK